MGLFEDLPPDQRAVLQMVLQRGRSYDEIASLLSIDRSAVRQRALDGFLQLTPDTVLPGPEQALVTDYLLRQLPDQVADQVYAYLEAAEADREWAIGISLQLAPLAGRPLPEIPGGYPAESYEPGAESYGPEDSVPEYHESEAEAGELQSPASGTADDEYSWESLAAATPSPEPAAERWSEPAAEPPSTDGGGHRDEPKSGRPRRIPLVAYVGALLVIIVIGVIVAVSGGSSPGPARTSTTNTHSTTGTSTTTTATQTTTTTPPPRSSPPST